MDTTSTQQPQAQTQTTPSPALPPEAIALAGKFFDAARQGQMAIFEQGLPAGLPANLTNDKGDSLVSAHRLLLES